jgi:hydroxymethylglutaryl-CoA reductase
MRSSRIQGFYKLTAGERLKRVQEFAGLSDAETDAVRTGTAPIGKLEHMAENVVGSIGIPLGIATNFLINGKDYLIPMATDESSVIAAASNGARMGRVKGGFTTSSSEPVMAVQIQIGARRPVDEIIRIVAENEARLVAMANTRSSTLPAMGAGAKRIETYALDGFYGKMVIARLLVDVRDAMGANVVNTMAEHIAPEIERLTGETVFLKVVDNYAQERVARARCVFDKDSMGGERVVDRFLQGYSCAYHDIHRATGHNKGFMNGVTAVVLATGNDTRAMESACHAYAARSGRYRALPVWGKNADGDLTGEVEIPVPVGTIGGLTKTHPVAAACLKILGVHSAREFGEVLAAVGLASKMAAERALADEGIQQGHMSMHATNIAVMAGAKDDCVRAVADEMIRRKNVSLLEAKSILTEMSR